MEVSVLRELTAFLVFSTRLGHVGSTVIAITSNRCYTIIIIALVNNPHIKQSNYRDCF